MALSFHDVLIASVQLRVGLLQNTGPDLVLLFALREDVVVVLVDRQEVIDHHEELLPELEESDHVGAFLVHPALLVLLLEAEGRKDPLLAEHAEGAD